MRFADEHTNFPFYRDTNGHPVYWIKWKQPIRALVAEPSHPCFKVYHFCIPDALSEYVERHYRDSTIPKGDSRLPARFGFRYIF